jgi:hypothetical protein
VQRHPERDAHDPRLGERCVDHSLLAELVEEPLRDPEDTPAHGDVLAEHDDPVVGGHLIVEGVVDRGDDVLLGHAVPSSSANT